MGGSLRVHEQLQDVDVDVNVVVQRGGHDCKVTSIRADLYRICPLALSSLYHVCIASFQDDRGIEQQDATDPQGGFRWQVRNLGAKLLWYVRMSRTTFGSLDG